MALPNSNDLSVIGWLASRNLEQLGALAKLRRIEPAHCQGLNSVASALLDSGNIESALRSMHRIDLEVLAKLRHPGAKPGSPATLVTPVVAASGFVDEAGDSPRLLCAERDLAILDALHFSSKAPSPRAAKALGPEAAQKAATAAWSTLCQVHDLVRELSRKPVATTKDHKLSPTNAKALHAKLGPGYDLDHLIRLSFQGNLVTVLRGEILPTSTWANWQDASREDQWFSVASAWWANAPVWLRNTVLEFPDNNWLENLEPLVAFGYPLAVAQPELQEWIVDATSLGVIYEGVPTAWARDFWAGKAPQSSLGASLPEVTPGVYVNEDFTLLASGPLSGTHRSSLDLVAQLELGGLIPRYRLTAASLLQGLQEGVAAAAILPLLKQVAINPLPESVVALIKDVCRKAHDRELSIDGEHTVIRLSSPELSSELKTDPALTVLGLRAREGGDPELWELSSSWPIERVLNTLLGGSYMALIVDDTRTPVVSALSHGVHQAPPPVDDLSLALDSLYADIQEAQRLGVPPGFGSIIEVATRTKTPLEIDVTMPDGTTVTSTMEPRSLSGGRLRGVEIKNSVERTLPVSRITAVRPVGPSLN